MGKIRFSFEDLEVWQNSVKKLYELRAMSKEL